MKKQEKVVEKDNKVTDIVNVQVRIATSKPFRYALNKLKRCQNVTVGNRLKICENLFEVLDIKDAVEYRYNQLIQKYAKRTIFGKIKQKKNRRGDLVISLKDEKKFTEEYKKMMEQLIKLKKVYTKDLDVVCISCKDSKKCSVTDEEQAAIIPILGRKIYEKQKNSNNISVDLNNSELSDRLQDVSRKDCGKSQDTVCNEEERKKEEDNCNCKKS